MNAFNALMEDEFDILTREYEKQAQRDLQAVTKTTAKAPTADEMLEKASTQKIPEDNKGYQLLKRMGYTEGTGLGKFEQGRTDPLPIVRKRGRSGVGGIESKPKTKRKKSSKVSQEGVGADRLSEYRQSLSANVSYKKLLKRLKAARSLIEGLDSKESIPKNPFWLPKTLMNDKGEIDGYEEDQLHGMEEENAFKAALAYLREQHLYCFWCGCKYVNSENLQNSCPGILEEDH